MTWVTGWVRVRDGAVRFCGVWRTSYVSLRLGGVAARRDGVRQFAAGGTQPGAEPAATVAKPDVR